MSILNNKRSIWLLTVIAVLLIGSALFSILRTPPLYQSQIVVMDSYPCNNKINPTIHCTRHARLLVHLSEYEQIRQAILRELSLPSDTFYKVSAQQNEREILVSVKAKNPQAAQKIANETIRQLNILNEEHMLKNRKNSLARLNEEAAKVKSQIQMIRDIQTTPTPVPTPTPSGYPIDHPWDDQSDPTTVIFDNPERALALYQERLDAINSFIERYQEGQFEMFEVVQPATYSDIPVPYWKQL